MAGLQRKVLSCEYDHIGVVVRRNHGGYELLEATGEGVTSFPLEDRIHAYSQGFCDLIAIRKVHFDRTAEALVSLISFTDRVEGKPYKLSLGKLVSEQYFDLLFHVPRIYQIRWHIFGKFRPFLKRKTSSKAPFGPLILNIFIDFRKVLHWYPNVNLLPKHQSLS
jgi:hypothetical protein